MLIKKEQKNIDFYLNEKFKNSDKYERSHLIHDWDQKEKSSIGVLADFIKRVGNPNGKEILDIGFGNGVMARIFANAGAIMSGVEIDSVLFNIAQNEIKDINNTVSLSLYDGKILPYSDKYFDYIYSTSVLEHADDPVIFLSEACRVLKSEGKMYLAFPNRFSLRDSHTGLYLIGYLPRFIIQKYLKLFNKGSLKDWNLHFISYFYLLRILNKHKIPFKVVMETQATTFSRRIFKKFFAIFNIHYGTFLSHIIIILEKK